MNNLKEEPTVEPPGYLLTDPAASEPIAADVEVEALSFSTRFDAAGAILLASENWTETTLSQPIVAEQGEQFIYNTGGSHLIGVIVAEVVGRPLEEYAREHLFTPLGIRDGDWMRSPQDEVRAERTDFLNVSQW